MVNGVAEPTVGVPRPGIVSQVSLKIRSLLTATPELSVLIFIVIVAYIAMGVFSKVEGTDVLSSTSIWMVVAGSFLLSTAIAIHNRLCHR